MQGHQGAEHLVCPSTWDQPSPKPLKPSVLLSTSSLAKVQQALLGMPWGHAPLLLQGRATHSTSLWSRLAVQSPPRLHPFLLQRPRTCWWKFMGLCSEQGRASDVPQADGIQHQHQQLIGREKALSSFPAPREDSGWAAASPRTGSPFTLQSQTS